MGKTIFKIINKIINFNLYNFGNRKNCLIIKIYKELLDIVYPPEEKCIVCNEEGFIGICSCCKNKIIRSTLDDKENISYGFYGGVLKRLILEFKYESNFIAGELLSQLLLEVINENKIKADVICYIPMNKKSIKKRGFNQCKIMAKNISYYTNIPISNCIIKEKNTKEQKSLNRNERALNIKDAFIIKNSNEIKGKDIILIDDVITTGATVNECKRILKKYGVNKITILTIAKSNI